MFQWGYRKILTCKAKCYIMLALTLSRSVAYKHKKQQLFSPLQNVSGSSLEQVAVAAAAALISHSLSETGHVYSSPGLKLAWLRISEWISCT